MKRYLKFSILIVQGGACERVGCVPCPPTDEFSWAFSVFDKFLSSRFPVSLENLGEPLGLYFPGLELSRARALERGLTASGPSWDHHRPVAPVSAPGCLAC